MASLTSFLPMLVSHLGISQAAIYERQRALVRLGLLPKPSGRGRGSGADATPQSTALIVLSVMATDNLSDMDERIASLAQSRIDEWRKRKYCRLTKKEVLLDALAEILGNPELARRVHSVEVKRRSLETTIYWVQRISKHVELSQFAQWTRPTARSSLEVSARFDAPALQHIAAMLAAERTVE
jgi:hypothetical protein